MKMTAAPISDTISIAQVASTRHKQHIGNTLMAVFIFLICATAYVPLAVNIAGLNLRASQILLPLVFGWAFIYKPTLRVKLSSLALTILALLLWTTLLFWTLVNIDGYPSPIHPLGRVLLLGLNLLHTAALYLLVINTRHWRRAVHAWLFSVTVLNCFLLITTVGAALGISLFRGLVQEEEAPVLVNGEFTSDVVSRFTFSGVTAGVMSAAALIIVVSMLVQPNQRHPARIWFYGLMATLGVILGFSRQGLVSLVAGITIVGLIMVLRGRIKHVIQLILLTPLVIVPGILLINTIPGGQSFFQAFAGRTLQLFQNEAYSTGTVGSRAIMWSGMLSDIMRNPLRGSGQDSYLTYLNAIDPNAQGSHNFPLEVLHASGLVGFLAYLLFHLLVLMIAWRGLFSHRTHHEDRWILGGLIGVYVAFWLSSLTNLIFTNPVYWSFIGLMIGATSLARVTQPATTAVPTNQAPNT